MAQFFRNFSGQSDGAAPSNVSYPWGAPETSRINLTTFGYPVYEESHSGNKEVPMVFNEVNQSTTIEIVARVRTTYTNTGSGTDYQMDIVTRGSGGSTTRTGRTTNFLRGTYINCEGYNNNTSFTFGSGSSRAFNPNQWYWIRVRTTGNDTMYRVWDDGATEPTGWDTATTTNVTGSGWVGIGSWSGNGTRYWSQVGIGTDGDTAPLAAVNNTMAVDNQAVATSEPNVTVTADAAPMADIGGALYGTYGAFIPGLNTWGLGYRIGSTPITVSPLSVATTNSTVSMVQDYLMALNALSVGVSMDNTLLVYNALMTLQNLAVATSESAPVTVQDYVMALNNLSVATTEEGNFDPFTTLIAAGQTMLVATLMDNIGLIQHHTLAPDDANVAVVLDNLTVTEDRTLEMADAIIATSMSVTDIVQDYIMALQNLMVNTTAENISMIQAYLLALQQLQVSTSLEQPYVFSPLIISPIMVTPVLEQIRWYIDTYLPDVINRGEITDAEIEAAGAYLQHVQSSGTFDNTEIDVGALLPSNIPNGNKY